jgi:hypothetical protein
MYYSPKTWTYGPQHVMGRWLGISHSVAGSHLLIRLILTKDRPDLSSERADPSGTALARTSSNSKLQTRPLDREGRLEWDCAGEDQQQRENYRSVLSSERALQNNKPVLSKENFKEKDKFFIGPRWVPDTKADCLSVVMWLWLDLTIHFQHSSSLKKLKTRPTGHESWSSWIPDTSERIGPQSY